MLQFDITRDEFYSIINNRISSGTEGAISFYNDKLVKLFFKEGDPNTYEYFMFKEKLKSKCEKIKLLASIPDFKNNLCPIGTINCNNEFCGYILSGYIGSSLYDIDKSGLDNLTKLDILKRAKGILDYFHSIGIVYGDIKAGNILLNEDFSNIAFCDLDNIRYAGYPMDNLPVNVIKYCNNYYGVMHDMFMDKKIDSYMFNLLTIEMFLGESSHNYKQVFEYLESSNDCSSVFDFVDLEKKPKVKSIFDELKCINSNYSGDYIINYL